MSTNSDNSLNNAVLPAIAGVLVVFITFIGLSLDRELAQSKKNYQKLTEAYRQLEVENMILKGQHFQNKP